MATPFNLRVKDQILVFACQKKWVQTTAEIKICHALPFMKMSKRMNYAVSVVLYLLYNSSDFMSSNKKEIRAKRICMMFN